MFGFRSDGVIEKDIPPFFKVIPHIMKTRSDSQVFFKQDISIEKMDDYIAKKAEQGIKLTYMNIIYAAIVRTISERTSLNRFVMNGRIYARNKIYISLAIKKSMSDEGIETTIKLPFSGSENIFEIKDKLDNIIEKNKVIINQNKTDRLAKIFSLIPNWLLKISIGILKFLDKRSMMPKKIIEASPFHTSAFLTNVGSLGLDYIYHHLYDFGTTSLFFAMGKKKKSYIYDDDEIKEEKCISIGFVGDERICDGYYYANSFKLLYRYLKRPELLEKNTIIIATNNEGKIKEIKNILQNYNILSLKDINFKDEIKEDENTFRDNSLKKARQVSKELYIPVIADDSGLCIEKYDGWPGIKTARFLGSKTTQRERNEHILNKMKDLEGIDRRAKFITSVSYVDYINNKEYTVQEELEGHISKQIRGENGFGFDEIFELEDGRTLAELSEQEKIEISCRRKALDKLGKLIN